MSGPCARVFASALQVTLDSDSLTQRLEVTNTGGDSLKLTAAFHTYFSVGAIAQTKVQRLLRRQPSCFIWSETCHSPVLSEDLRMLLVACTAWGVCYLAGASPYKGRHVTLAPLGRCLCCI